MRIIFGIILMLVVFQGCSVYKAMTAPDPVAVESIKEGSTRAEVMGTFGMPKTSEVTDGKRTDVYEFIDGHHGASKLRVLPYIAGCVFTLCLTELVFWPLESYALQGTEGRAIVTFGPDDKVTSLVVTEKDGTPWGEDDSDEDMTDSTGDEDSI